jgi:hypothetical protein
MQAGHHLVLLAGVVAIIVRFRRSDTEQRLQLKWFMSATALAAVAAFAAAFRNNPLPGPTPRPSGAPG